MNQVNEIQTIATVVPTTGEQPIKAGDQTIQRPTSDTSTEDTMKSTW